MAAKKNKRRKRRTSQEVSDFVKGRTDTVTLERGPVALGFSPAREGAAMCRTPTKRDLRRADRRGKRAAIDAARDS